MADHNGTLPRMDTGIYYVDSLCFLIHIRVEYTSKPYSVRDRIAASVSALTISSQVLVDLRKE